MVQISRVRQGQILYEVSNFDITNKEVLRAEVDHIHFKYPASIYKGAGLKNLFYSEELALKYLKKILLLKLEEVKNDLKKYKYSRWHYGIWEGHYKPKDVKDLAAVEVCEIDRGTGMIKYQSGWDIKGFRYMHSKEFNSKYYRDNRG